MAKRKKPKPPIPRYDRAVWSSLDATIQERIPARLKGEEDRRVREWNIRRDLRRMVRVGLLLLLVTRGSAAQPVQDHGDVVIPADIWGCWIFRLARAMRVTRGLPPPPSAAELGGSEGVKAGEIVLRLALDGASRDEVIACAADGVRRLRRLRSEGFRRAIDDLPAGMLSYFEAVARAFWAWPQFLPDRRIISDMAFKELAAINGGAARPHLRIAGATPSLPPVPPRPKGRPPDTNAAEDRRIAQAWSSGQYQNKVQLADALNMKVESVKLALERDRKRKARKANPKDGSDSTSRPA